MEQYVHKLYDVTLRDGNHALRHKLDSKFVEEYCAAADESGVWAIEVGHGNGLGASSYLVGKSAESDVKLLESARKTIRKSKLSVHAIPGIATIKRDIAPALEIGVDVFRIATHSTEANTAQRHIEFLAEKGAVVHGVLMMSHMNDIKGLVEQSKLMVSYGATAVVIMDSAGHFIPPEVHSRVKSLKDEIGIEIGFHAHNNLGVAIGNARSAFAGGATIIDGASMGLGAGSGNAQLENIVSTFNREELFEKEIGMFLGLSELVEKKYPKQLPRTTASSVRSGLAGAFSGYAPQVNQIALEFGIEISDLWVEIGKRKLVAGQESMIREIAQDLMNL
jgi:4-hydroxy 2-oxovalerate aldolase